jgi:hypothetical protein
MPAATSSNPAYSKATSLLPKLSQLDNREKLFILQFLIAELSREEHGLMVPGRSYPIWSPIGAFSAADKLKQLLEEDKKQK